MPSLSGGIRRFYFWPPETLGNFLPVSSIMREENGGNFMQNTEGNMGLKRTKEKGKRVQGRRWKMIRVPEA